MTKTTILSLCALVACGSAQVSAPDAPTDASSPADATLPVEASAPAIDAASLDASEDAAPSPACASYPLAATAVESYAPYGFWHAIHIVTDGDSLTTEPLQPLPDGGLGANSISVWVPIASYLLGTMFDVQDTGQNGWTCTTLRQTAPSRVDSQIDTTRPNFVTIECGANDIAGLGLGTDAGTAADMDAIVDEIEGYCDDRVKAGWLGCILPVPTYSGYYTTAGYDHYVARIRAECAQHAVACPDLAADSRLNHYDLHWFYDSTHLNQNGGAARALDMLPTMFAVGRAAVDAGTWDAIMATQ